MMTNRVPCDLADCGCTRTIGADRYAKLFGHEPGGWICPTHWRMVSRDLKRLNARHNRERRRYGEIVRQEAYARLWRVIWRQLGLV